MNHHKPLRLITIPISHYCEKVRWALDKLQFAYVEEPHMPPFHRLATTPVGGKSVPVLVAETDAFTDSSNILKYLDEISPNNAKLYPTDSALCQQVEELEELFDEQLGVATRLWGYSHTMNQPKLIQSVWTKGVPFLERALFPVVFPPMRSVTQRIYNINTETVPTATTQIKNIFAQVSKLLADGRTYLIGDKISAADITFAALAAPAISPPEHPMRRANSNKLPQQMLSEIQEFKATPAGKFALRLYRQERHKV